MDQEVSLKLSSGQVFSVVEEAAAAALAAVVVAARVDSVVLAAEVLAAGEVVVAGKFSNSINIYNKKSRPFKVGIFYSILKNLI